MAKVILSGDGYGWIMSPSKAIAYFRASNKGKEDDASSILSNTKNHRLFEFMDKDNQERTWMIQDLKKIKEVV